MFYYLLLLSFPYDSLMCRIDSSLHGIFKKQSHSIHNIVFDSTFKDPVVYDELSISATAISEYGDCYEKVGSSYVLGIRRMGRPVCFRCITAIVHSSNILQLAHQQEDVCYESVKEAKTTCFDPKLVSLSDGSLIFRSEGSALASCGLDGRFSVAYQLNKAPLHCLVNSGSIAENCDTAPVMNVKFRNCSFPDFEMTWKCVGSWQDRNGIRYLVMENEENEEYRCGMTVTSSADIVVHFSNDSSCAQLSVSNAFETYTFKSEDVARPFTTCQFSDWLVGEYDTLSVAGPRLQYSHSGGAVPVLSYCLNVHGDRIQVYSETKCGEALGYHCIWFNQRSRNLIEFKTTTPQDHVNSSTCSSDAEFSISPWSTAVVKRTSPVPCGILGSYRTPSNLRIDECYNVSVDCERKDTLKISAYHCTSGIVFDSRTYTCLASWKENLQLYMFTTRSQEHNTCFVTHYQKGRLYLASTGPECVRNFNFTDHADKTMVLEEDVSCKPSAKPKYRRPVTTRLPPTSTATAIIHRVVPPTEETTTPVQYSGFMGTSGLETYEFSEHNQLSDIHWLWDGNLCTYMSIWSTFIYILIAHV